MSHRLRARCLMFSQLFFLAAAALLIVELDVLQSWEVTPWLVILGLTCCVPIGIAWLSRSFDLFEPVHPIALATFIYFGVMVVVLLRNDAFSMLNIDYRGEIPRVVGLAWLAIMSFYAAYYTGARRSVAAGAATRMSQADLAYAHRWSLLVLALFGTLFALWVVVGRVPLWSLWIFGDASYGTWDVAATGVKVGHLYAAQEALPACLLLLVATRSRRPWSLTAFLLLVAITLLFAGLGVRARLLLLWGSAVAFYYLNKGTRPAAWKIALFGLIVFYVVIGAIDYYRGPQVPIYGQSAFAFGEMWQRFVGGSDIATTTAAYVHWIPVFGYDWGKDALNILLTPIPSAIWPDKYLLLGQAPIEEFKATGAAAAFFTEFYKGFGSVGVVFGMALMGWLCRRVYSGYQANPRDPFAQISVALLWAYLFHIYGRNSFTLIVFGVVYIFAPVWIVRWRIRRHQKQTVPIPATPRPANHGNQPGQAELIV